MTDPLLSGAALDTQLFVIIQTQFEERPEMSSGQLEVSEIHSWHKLGGAYGNRGELLISIVVKGSSCLYRLSIKLLISSRVCDVSSIKR